MTIRGLSDLSNAMLNNAFICLFVNFKHKPILLLLRAYCAHSQFLPQCDPVKRVQAKIEISF